MTRSRRPRQRAVVALAVVVIAFGGCMGTDEAETASGPAPSAEVTPTAVSPVASASSTARVPGEVALQPGSAPRLADLVRPDGSTFELATLAGAPVLVFFGYTHCPDVCPATLSQLFEVIEAEPETQVLFVSIDPERDTPEFLAEWTAYLPDHLLALTGSPGAVRRVADAWGVRYARVETTSTAGYTMSHTADVFLLDGEGNLQRTYPFGTGAEQIVADLRDLAPA